MTNNSNMSNCGSPDKNYSGANGSGRSSARGARNSVNGKAGARMEAAEESGRGSSAQNCTNSAQNGSGAARNCSNSAQNCSNSAQNCSNSATKGATSRMEAAESDLSSSKKQLNRYKCKNCGAIHEGDSAPKSCMKCDSDEFRKM